MKISNTKKDKISEQILAFLYSLAPRPEFTSKISAEIARDEEFIKKILLELKTKGLVTEIKKNPLGEQYSRRSRWRLTDAAYNAYKTAGSLNNPVVNNTQDKPYIGTG